MKSRLSVRILIIILIALAAVCAFSISVHAESTGNITPSDPVAYGRFGGAVSVYIGSSFDEYYAIAGSEGNGTGAAYIFKYDGNNWKQSAKLIPGDGLTSDKFGCSVAISKNASGEYYAIVGAYEADKGKLDVGKAYVFKRSSTGVWTQQAIITAGDYTSGDKFGYSVSLSGDYAVIGAYGDDDKGDWAGSAYIFKREGTNWTQKQKIFAQDAVTGDSFGETVSIFGEYAIIGSAWSDVSNKNSSGAAYIFKRNTATDQWLQEKKLTPSDLTAGDNFGTSVSVFNDGTDWYAVAGSVRDDDKGMDSGSAYIFKKETTDWNQKAKLTASDGVKSDNFGKSVCVSGGKAGQDKYVIIGANKTDTTDAKGNPIYDIGAAYLFKGRDSTWTQHKKLVSAIPAAYDYMGSSVALWFDQTSGNYSVIAGALGKDVSAGNATLADAGAAMIFSTASEDRPIISDIPDQRTRKNTATNPIYFTVTDPGTAPASLEVSVISANTSLIPNADIKIDNSSAPFTPTLVNNTASLYLVITPAAAKSGDAKITVTVRNKTTNKSATEEFVITVTSAPTIELEFYQKAIKEAVPVSCKVTVADENTASVLTVTAVSKNTTIIPNNNISLIGSDGSYILTATPLAEKFGSAPITVTVSNGLEQTSAELVIIISVPPVIYSIDNQITNEDKQVLITFIVEDKDTTQSNITMTGVSDDTAIVPVNSMIFGTSDTFRTLTITPALNKHGEVTITVTANDGVQDSDPEEFVLTINPINDDPTISDIADQVTTEDTPKDGIPITIKDVDGDVLTLSAVSSSQTLVPDSNIYINGYVASGYKISSAVYNGTDPLWMKIIPSADASGNALITVTVSDGLIDVEKSFILTVERVNDPPTISQIEDQDVNQDASISSISFTINDLDGDALTVSGTSDNQELVKDASIRINSANPYTAYPSSYNSLYLKITPEPGKYGTARITITVEDKESETASASFTVTVHHVPKQPTIQSIASQTILEDTLITNAAEIPVVVSDPDGDVLSITAKARDESLIPTANIYINNFPGGSFIVSQSDYNNVKMKLTPAPDKNGTTFIDVTVSDGKTTDVTTSFLVTITPVNDPPVISGTPLTSINENELYTFTPIAEDIDNQLNTLVFSVADNPAWLTVDPKTGKLSGTPKNQDVGIAAGIVITVTDPEGASASLPAFNITVINVNDAPVISAIATQIIDEDTATDPPINFTVTDADGGKLTVTMTSSNKELVPENDDHIRLNGMGPSYLVNASPNVPIDFSLVLIPAKDKNGTTEITITVDDGTGGETAVSKKSFILNVLPKNDPPVIDGIPGTAEVDDIPAQTTKESTPTSAISFSVSDKEGGLIKITGTSDNPNLVTDANIKISGTDANGYLNLTISGTATLKMTITPVTGKSGQAKITVSAYDGEDTTTTDFILTVISVNDAPVIHPISPQTTNEETPVTVNVTVQDTEGGEMYLSVTSDNATLVPADYSHIQITVDGKVYGPTNAPVTMTAGTEKSFSIQVIPAENQIGAAILTLRLIDGTGEDQMISERTFNLTVKNEPPKIEGLPSQLFTNEDVMIEGDFTVNDTEGGMMSLTITSDKETLIPADDLHIRLTNSDGKSFGPQYLFMLSKDVPEKLKMSITPYKDQSGTAKITLTIVDSSNDKVKTVRSFYLTVNPVNDPPVIENISPKSGKEGVATDLNLTVSDPDSRNLTISVISDNEILVPNNSDHIQLEGLGTTLLTSVTPGQIKTVRLTLIPTFGESVSNKANITVTVKDDSGNSQTETASTSFVLTVEQENQPPVISGISTSYTMDEDIPQTISFMITDREGGNVLVTAVSDKTDLLTPDIEGFGGEYPINLPKNETAPVNLTLNPKENQTGTAVITLTVADMKEPDKKDSRTLYVTVKPVNDPPVILELPASVVIAKYEPANLDFKISDIEGGTMNLEIISDNEALFPQDAAHISLVNYSTVLNANETRSLTLKLTPAEKQSGEATLTLALKDGELDPVIRSIKVTVQYVNEVPEIQQIGTVETNEDEIVEFPVSIIDKEGGNATILVESLSTDKIPNDETHILINGYPSGYSLGMTANYQETVITLALMPNQNKFGTANMKISVTDGENTVTQNFAVNIRQVNDAPAITGIVNQETEQDTPKENIQVIVSDLEGGNITVSVHAESTGLEPDGNENLISDKGIDLDGFGSSRTVWIEPGKTATLNLSLAPNTAESGRTRIIITANDGADEAQKSFLLLVDSVNKTPVISEIGNWNIREDESVEIPFTLSDIEGGTMKVTATSANTKVIPNGNIRINDFADTYLADVPENEEPLELRLFITPEKDESGTAEITVTVEDGDFAPKRFFYITVKPVNDKPVISPIANQSTTEDNPKTLSFTISDKEGGPVVVSVRSLGDLVPNDDAHISIDGFGMERTATLPSVPFNLILTPASGKYGKAAIEITVTDGTGDDAQTTTTQFYFMNDLNIPPVVSEIENQVMFEDSPQTITFTVTDTEGGAIKISAASSDAQIIPDDDTHISLNGYGKVYQMNLQGGKTETVELVISPKENISGTATLTVTVEEGENRIVRTFLAKVEPVNDPAVIAAIPNQTTPEDTAITIPFSVSDIEGGKMIVSVVSLDPEKIPNDNTHLNIDGFGWYRVTTIPALPGKSDFKLVVTPALHAWGTADIEVNVEQGDVKAEPVHFQIKIEPVNNPPVISGIRNQNTQQDTPINNIAFTVSDPDGGNNILVSVSSSDGMVVPNDPLYIDISGQGTEFLIDSLNPGEEKTLNLSLTPGTGVSGTSTITISADDGTASGEKTFLFRVNDLVNTKPTLYSISTQVMNQGDDPKTVTLMMSDADGGALDITVTSSNKTLLPEAYANINLIEGDNTPSGPFATVSVEPGIIKNMVLKLTPLAGQSGDSTVKVNVSDGIDSVERSFTLAVNEMPNAPTISEIFDLSTKEDTATEVLFAVDDSDTPLDSLKITAASSNPSVVPTGNLVIAGAGANRTLKITPSPNLYGETMITVTVSDGIYSDSTEFTLNVLSVPDAPVITPISSPRITEEGVELKVNVTISDPDTPLDDIVVKAFVTADLNRVVKNINVSGTGANRIITITPDNKSGNATIEVTADDGSGETAIASFTLKVNPLIPQPGETPPEITGIVSPRIMKEDETLAFEFQVKDAETPSSELVVGVESLRTDLFPDTNITLTKGTVSGTWRLSIIPALNKSGDGDIRITANDSVLDTQADFTLRVLPVNDAPVIYGIPEQMQTDENYPISVEFSASDVETVSRNLKVTATSSDLVLIPAKNLKIECVDLECNTHRLTITPAGNRAGLTIIKVTVNDESLAFNSVVTEEFYLTVGVVKDGDVNNDGKVDLADAITVLKLLTGITTDYVNLGADVNGDWKIGLHEAVYILQVLATNW